MGSRQFETAAVDQPGTTLARRSGAADPKSARRPSRPAGQPARVTKGADVPSPEVQATARGRDGGRAGSSAGSFLLAVQRRYGNRVVQRLVQPPGDRRPAGPAPVLQPELILGSAGDRYEREADRVARQVAGAPTRAEGVAAVAHRPAVPRVRGAEGGTVDPGVAQAIGRARAGGQGIPEPTRAPLERSLGADLAGVRVHADARADQLNRALRSRAFTSGQDIFFRRGAYLPQRPAGAALLAHEVAHVLQQQGAPPADMVQCFRPEHFDTLDEAQNTPYGEFLYTQMNDPLSRHVDKPFSSTQRNNIYKANEYNNHGQLRSDTSPDQELFPVNTDETPHVDHRYPKSAGGSNSYANAAVLSAATNISKGNRPTDITHDPDATEALAPYQHFQQHPQAYPGNVGVGMLFSQAQRDAIYAANRQYYQTQLPDPQGEIHSDSAGHEALFGNDSSQIPHIDHITPKAQNGTNYYFNARVISAEENIQKGGGDRAAIGFARDESLEYEDIELQMTLPEFIVWKSEKVFPERLNRFSKADEVMQEAFEQLSERKPRAMESEVENLYAYVPPTRLKRQSRKTDRWEPTAKKKKT
jgi:hypothetical protein